MIFAEIKDIKKYNVSDKIISFIESLNSETPTGRYEIEERAYASINEYETKEHVNCDLEAHKKYIDIQLLLSGEERIDFRKLDELTVKTPYDENRDILFYNLSDKVNSVYLEKGNFALFYPEDAHRPQMNSSAVSRKVKKVVVKILA